MLSLSLTDALSLARADALADALSLSPTPSRGCFSLSLELSLADALFSLADALSLSRADALFSLGDALFSFADVSPLSPLSIDPVVCCRIFFFDDGVNMDCPCLYYFLYTPLDLFLEVL
jgi:hypothetical protein